MPPKNYKNLPSIKKALYLKLVEVADRKGMSLSELVQSALNSYVSLALGELPVEEWQKV